MDDPGTVATSRRPARGAMSRPLAGLLAALAVALLAALAFRVTVEVSDRRSEGFCRPDHGIPGATASEDRTWWPLGERCYLRFADEATRVRNPGWSLTALVVATSAIVTAGAVAPPRSVRRRLAWSAAVPALPVAALVLVTVHPQSLARLVALTSISVGFGSILAGLTAVIVWYVMRGRLLPTILGSWLAWSALLFLQGRAGIGP